MFWRQGRSHFFAAVDDVPAAHSGKQPSAKTLSGQFLAIHEQNVTHSGDALLASPSDADPPPEPDAPLDPPPVPVGVPPEPPPPVPVAVPLEPPVPAVAPLEPPPPASPAVCGESVEQPATQVSAAKKHEYLVDMGGAYTQRASRATKLTTAAPIQSPNVTTRF